MPASSLKENVSFYVEEGRIEKVICSPRSLMDAGTRDETTLVTEETGLLGGPTCECLSPLEDQCKANLIARSVSTPNSSECTVVIEPSKVSAFLVTGPKKQWWILQ